MLIIVLIFLLHFIFGLIVENLSGRFVSLFFNIFLFALILVFSVGVTYTADWQMYYWFFKYEEDTTDKVYYSLTLLFKKWGLPFEDLFKFHIVAINVLYYFLIRKFTRNYFYVMLVFVVINYVHSVNQLRFFLGLPIIQIGFYYLLYKRNLLISLPLLVLGVLCHSALVLLLILIPMFYISQQKYLKKILVATAVSSVIILIALKTGLMAILLHFSAYFEDDATSSFLGGLFNAFPYIIYITFLYIENKKMIKIFPEYENDKLYQYLYKLTFFPVIFIPPAFVAPVLGHRYVIPFIVIWVIFYLYIIKDLNHKQRFTKFLVFMMIHIIVTCFYYIFPDFIAKDNHYLHELDVMLKSINYLKSFYY
ncbi:EpsG family protein [Chryseobacterium sp. KACC 21268]|nr:EpsG family protein [Chryseobacterium sp. KACC 21268]